jgi:hypothetical protein
MLYGKACVLEKLHYSTAGCEFSVYSKQRISNKMSINKSMDLSVKYARDRQEGTHFSAFPLVIA